MKLKTIFAVAAVAIVSSPAFAAPLTHTWIGGSTGNWATDTNWSGNTVPGIAGTEGGKDAVIISGSGVSVTNTGNIEFSGADAAKNGTFIAFSLLDGAKLDNTGNFSVYGSSGSGGTFRNAVIGAGSRLIVSGTLSVGISNNGAQTSNWTINGEVTANQMRGYRGASATGGFILNIDAGRLTMNGFNWGNGTAGLGTINISNGGTVDFGIMSTNWLSSTRHTINFLDGTGSITFAHENWATQQAVENLIANGQILSAGSLASPGFFNIIDNGSSWTVTAIPEPSTAALVGAAATAAGLLRAKAKRNR